jgi:dissimilatory sulfite reductase (desulfoviridin) alpha/beta subunit
MTEEIFDLVALKKIGMIQQKQKEYFAMRLHAIAGDFTAIQMKKVAEIAEKYGQGQIHCSTRQGIEIHFVHHTNLKAAKLELESVGVTMGACGPRVRIVAGCPGALTCRWGIIDTKEMASQLDSTWFRKETPHKFKMAVTGCPHNCAKATENDIGVMGGIIPEWVQVSCSNCGLCVNICPTNAIQNAGDEYVLDLPKCINCSICTASCPTGAWKIASKGYILWIGGTMGKKPRLATRLGSLIESKERLYDLVRNTIEYYQKTGRKKERFGHMIDRISLDVVKEAILRGK